MKRRGGTQAARAYRRAPRVSRSTPWRAAHYAVLDLELTGLDPRRDHVISLGVVPVQKGRALAGASLYRVVRPPVPVPPASIRVHGLRPVDLEGAPPLAEVLDELLEALAGRVLVAHFAGIEARFLRRSLPRGVRLRQPVVDIFDLARRLDALERRDWRRTPAVLADLASSRGLPTHSAHNALGDALTSAQLFLVLATKLERHGVATVGDLAREWPPRQTPVRGGWA